MADLLMTLRLPRAPRAVDVPSAATLNLLPCLSARQGQLAAGRPVRGASSAQKLEPTITRSATATGPEVDGAAPYGCRPAGPVPRFGACRRCSTGFYRSTCGPSCDLILAGKAGKLV